MKTLLITTVSLMAVLFANAQSNPTPHVKPVSDIDVNRFTGTWYEISRLPNAVDSDLNNVCIKFDTKENAVVQRDVIGFTEKGRKVNVKGKLTYQGSGIFSGADGGVYMVLSVDADYQHVLMGTPDHKYLWVMSRTKELSDKTYKSLLKKAGDMRYDVAGVQLVSHK